VTVVAAEAAALAVEHAGPSVRRGALVLAGTFGALLVSGVPFFVEIGFAVTIGILLVAFVVALLLVPATTALLGRAAWWPGVPRPSKPTLGAVTLGDREEIGSGR
jgi:RND superfamily putative drug exporter